MRILLISPPAGQSLINKPKPSWVPLGLGYLGSVLRGAGHDVAIDDMYTYSWKEVESKIRKEDPELVGISCLTVWRAQAVKVAQIVRQCDPNVKILMGGPHATFFPEHMFRLSPVDFVVMGEGEKTILELANILTKNEDVSKVKGVAFQKDGVLVKTPPKGIHQGSR